MANRRNAILPLMDAAQFDLCLHADNSRLKRQLVSAFVEQIKSAYHLGDSVKLDVTIRVLGIHKSESSRVPLQPRLPVSGGCQALPASLGVTGACVADTIKSNKTVSKSRPPHFDAGQPSQVINTPAVAAPTLTNVRTSRRSRRRSTRATVTGPVDVAATTLHNSPVANVGPAAVHKPVVATATPVVVPAYSGSLVAPSNADVMVALRSKDRRKRPGHLLGEVVSPVPVSGVASDVGKGKGVVINTETAAGECSGQTLPFGACLPDRAVPSPHRVKAVVKDAGAAAGKVVDAVGCSISATCDGLKTGVIMESSGSGAPEVTGGSTVAPSDNTDYASVSTNLGELDDVDSDSDSSVKIITDGKFDDKASATVAIPKTKAKIFDFAKFGVDRDIFAADAQLLKDFAHKVGSDKGSRTVMRKLRSVDRLASGAQFYRADFLDIKGCVRLLHQSDTAGSLTGVFESLVKNNVITSSYLRPDASVAGGYTPSGSGFRKLGDAFADYGAEMYGSDYTNIDAILESETPKKLSASATPYRPPALLPTPSSSAANSSVVACVDGPVAAQHVQTSKVSAESATPCRDPVMERIKYTTFVGPEMSIPEIWEKADELLAKRIPIVANKIDKIYYESPHRFINSLLSCTLMEHKDKGRDPVAKEAARGIVTMAGVDNATKNILIKFLNKSLSFDPVARYIERGGPPLC